MHDGADGIIHTPRPPAWKPRMSGTRNGDLDGVAQRSVRRHAFNRLSQDVIGKISPEAQVLDCPGCRYRWCQEVQDLAAVACAASATIEAANPVIKYADVVRELIMQAGAASRCFRHAHPCRSHGP